MVCYSVVERMSNRQSSRINTFELKGRIVKQVGHERAEKYFYYLKRFLGLKISKHKFDKLCFAIIGRENIILHNHFISSILKNASFAKAPPNNATREEGSSNVKFASGQSKNLQPAPEGRCPTSPRKGRLNSVHDRKFMDNLNLIGTYDKIQGTSCDESAAKAVENVHNVANSSDLRRHQELISVGSKTFLEIASVEDGEEVEQAPGSPCIQSRSPVWAPLGISIGSGGGRKTLYSSSVGAFHLPKKGVPHTCYSSFELPDSGALRDRLEWKLEDEGLKVSIDCANLLNNGLDSYLKRLIKPCLEIGQARCNQEQIRQLNNRILPGIDSNLPDRHMQRSNHHFSASLLDFRTAMELNPQLLGEDWPIQLEKICFNAMEK